MYTDNLGDKGREVHFPSAPNDPKLPQNAGGRCIRFQPDYLGWELVASRTQFGHAFDVWGERLLINNNNHAIHEVLPARYLGKNDLFAVANVTQSISDHGNAAEVFPTTANPEHQLLTDVGVMTSACGITTYLEGAFPDGFDQVVFTAEPVSNLVHVDILGDDGASFTASRIYQDKEFLTSKDAWFRPVNMYIGPDGALYLLDYHRQIIEHPEWMADDVVASGALYNGTDQGRIYRISAQGSKKMNWSNQIDLESYSDEALVEKLADKNIWWRRNAQRLLIERIKDTVPPSLEEMAKSTTSPIGRTHALWTLQGTRKLPAEWVMSALSDPNQRDFQPSKRSGHQGQGPGNGMQVYEKNCALCHQMTENMGHPFGPDLASLRNRRYENILADILDPNLSIADGYDLWEVELQNGEILQGIIASETPSAITLDNAGGINNTIPRKSIKEYKVLEVSGMTQGLEHNISVEEMADLLAFLKGEKSN